MFDDLPADRQAEAGALRLGGHGIADLAELLENQALLLANYLLGVLDKRQQGGAKRVGLLARPPSR